MTELIKQRLLGMLIVVVAGVVFLPDLLDGKKQMTKEEFKKIPPKPALDEQPLVSNFSTDEIEQALAQMPESKQEVAVDDIKSTETEADADHDNVQVNKLPEAEPIIDVPANKPVADSESEAIAEVVKVKAEFEKQAWILQLGSFKHKENVDSLRDKIKQAGYQTFIKPVETKGGVLQKVYIGPELTRDKLEKAQKELKEITGLDGKITQYNPIN